MKKRSLSLFIIVCMFFVFATRAGSQMKEPRIPPQKTQPKRVENKSLDRNVRLDFKIVSQDGKAENFYLITASENYEIEINQQDKSKHFSRLEIQGKVKLLVENRILVNYEFEYRHHNNSKPDFRKDIKLHSSVILKPGQEIEVGNPSDKILKIKAAYVEKLE